MTIVISAFLPAIIRRDTNRPRDVRICWRGSADSGIWHSKLSLTPEDDSLLLPSMLHFGLLIFHRGNEPKRRVERERQENTKKWPRHVCSKCFFPSSSSSIPAIWIRATSTYHLPFPLFFPGLHWAENGKGKEVAERDGERCSDREESITRLEVAVPLFTFFLLLSLSPFLLPPLWADSVFFPQIIQFSLRWENAMTEGCAKPYLACNRMLTKRQARILKCRGSYG